MAVKAPRKRQPARAPANSEQSTEKSSYWKTIITAAGAIAAAVAGYATLSGNLKTAINNTFDLLYPGLPKLSIRSVDAGEAIRDEKSYVALIHATVDKTGHGVLTGCHFRARIPGNTFDSWSSTKDISFGFGNETFSTPDLMSVDFDVMTLERYESKSEPKPKIKFKAACDRGVESDWVDLNMSYERNQKPIERRPNPIDDMLK